MVRSRSQLFLLLALLVASPRTAGAQEREVGDELEHAGRDLLHVWSQPARTGADDLPALAGVLGGTALLTLVDDDVQGWVADHPGSLLVKALGPFRDDGPFAGVARTHVIVPVAAALWLGGVAADSEGLRDAGMGCATANLATTASRHLIGRVTGRGRPGAAEGPWDFRPGWAPWEYRSFPTGHGSNIMACSTFLNRHLDLGAGEPVLYALSTGIALARVADRAHWLSDSLFGLLYGWAVGKVVADRFEARDAEGATGDPAAASGPVLWIEWTLPTSSKSLLPFIL